MQFLSFLSSAIEVDNTREVDACGAAEQLAGGHRNLACVRQDVAAEMFGEENRAGSAKKLADARALAELSGPVGRAEVDRHYDPRRAEAGGRVGGVPAAGSYVDPALVRHVQAGDPRFVGEAHSLYHAEKHYREMPESERHGRVFDDYLRGVRRTILDPSGGVESELQNGVVKLMFKRLAGEEPDRTMMQTIVYVRPDGTAILATYMPGRR